MSPDVRAAIQELPLTEKLDLLEALWDELAANEDAVATPQWHRDELDARCAEADAEPNGGSTWPEVRQRITGK